MGLETGNYIDDLVTTNPVGSTDAKSQGDDHIRLLKTVLKTTFPNADRVFRFEEAGAAKTANYTILATDQRALITFDCTSGALTAALTAISGLFAGWLVTIMKTDSSANAVTVDPNGSETINGAATYMLNEQYEFVTLMVQDSEFKIVGSHVTLGTASGNIPQLGSSGLDSAIHGSAVPVGFMGDWFSSTPPTGWLGVYGTLGNASSGADNASDAYEDLFTHLYGALADSEAPVSGGRGASAAADWAANKPILMPDTRGRMFIGAGTGLLTEDVSAGSVSTANDTFTVVSNTDRWITGMPVEVSTDGALPTGLSASTTYYIIRDSATTVQFATTLANAVAGTAIDLTAAGSGTHTIEFTLGARTTGARGGEETHAITQAELPPARLFIANTDTPTDGSPNLTASQQMVKFNTGGGNITYQLNGSSTEATVGRTSPMGDGAAIQFQPPYVGAYKIIRY